MDHPYTAADPPSLLQEIMAYSPFFVILVGLFGNTAAFVIFRTNKEMVKLPSMTYLSFVAVTDTLSLFCWNLDHYFEVKHNMRLENINMVVCRISLFTQYTSLQSSALILSVLCIDRYISITSKPGSFRSTSLPFNSPRSAFIWSISIIVLDCFFNLHVLFMAGDFDERGVFDCYTTPSKSTLYTDAWDKV
jgi:hypothetical protein